MTADSQGQATGQEQAAGPGYAAGAPFRLGLVGAGRMGRTHLRALAGSERVAVTAIAEMSAAARAAVGGLGVAPGVTLHASAASGRWVKISEVTNAVEQWEGDLWPGG
jgi:predicted homoserine dehydrogenase-like protein